MGVCNCSMFCCMLLYVHSSIAIILIGEERADCLLNLSSWCLVMVERLFLAVSRGCLRFVIVVFPDHTHLLFLLSIRDTCCCLSARYVLHHIRASLSMPYSFNLERRILWSTRSKAFIKSTRTTPIIFPLSRAVEIPFPTCPTWSHFISMHLRVFS